MKFTSEQLANAMGLKVGDIIRVRNEDYKITEYYELRTLDNEHTYNLGDFVKEDYEIIKPKKKIGEQFCKDIQCAKCPIKILNCGGRQYNTLFEIIAYLKDYYDDKEVYDMFKARLDKEIE